MKENIYEKYYKGSWVRVKTHNGNSEVGLLQEANFERIVLLPSIIEEGVLNKLELRLQNDRPIIISMPVNVVEPLSENYVRKLIKKYPIIDDVQLELF